MNNYSPNTSSLAEEIDPKPSPESEPEAQDQPEPNIRFGEETI